MTLESMARTSNPCSNSKRNVGKILLMEQLPHLFMDGLGWQGNYKIEEESFYEHMQINRMFVEADKY